MKRDEKGFLYPYIYREKCIDCNICRKICPANDMINLNNPIKIFACKNKDTEKRISSSSGGVFSEIAKKIINDSGTVYGASFNDDWQVEHIRVSNENDLEKIKRSKYVQSDMKNVFKNIKEDLKDNKNILFSGTPCQVHAVKNSNKFKDDNIFYVDIVCHGVPSPGVFEDYKRYLENKYKSKIININFRYKNDETTQNIKIDFENRYSYISNYNKKEVFYKLFLDNKILRDSCYDCYYKKFERIGDISLADFWGVEKSSAKALKDIHGISLILINTEKGLNMFEKIKDKFVFCEISKEECYPYNCFFNFEKPKDYNYIWEEYINKGFKAFLQK